MREKPFSQASENNKAPILKILKAAFENTKTVLEIGSGTGQHAVYFASNLPHLKWQPTDREIEFSGITLWLDESGLTNIYEPLVLDVNNLPWKVGDFDGVFTANTLHIMSKVDIENMFLGIGQVLSDDGTLCIYGPFNYSGEYTSESNERFDGWLYKQNPESAIRDFEWVNSLAENIGLTLIHDHTMPANNRLLEWIRQS